VKALCVEVVAERHIREPDGVATSARELSLPEHTDSHAVCCE